MDWFLYDNGSVMKELNTIWTLPISEILVPSQQKRKYNNYEERYSDVSIDVFGDSLFSVKHIIASNLYWFNLC